LYLDITAQGQLGPILQECRFENPVAMQKDRAMRFNQVILTITMYRGVLPGKIGQDRDIHCGSGDCLAERHLV
jgi:hypothetical protein